MSLSHFITQINSSNYNVKKYRINIYSSDDFLPVYTYQRNSISYNGVYLPSLTSIYTEANKLRDSSSFNCGLRNDYHSILNLTISRNRLTNLSSLSPKNSDVLGSYLSSSSVSTTVLSTQIHYYKYGYVKEEFLTKNLSLNLINGEFLTSQISSSYTVGYVTCVTLIIKYYITSLPPPVDTRIETTCCLLVCCEPTKYKLI